MTNDDEICQIAAVEYEHGGAAIETCDTLALARFAMPDLDCYTLANLVERLGVGGINSHDALDDAYACAGVFFKLIESLKKGSVNDGYSH
jgi:DNA polymerase III epsilon subunit-like protein